jgi:uncharacterized protein
MDVAPAAPIGGITTENRTLDPRVRTLWLMGSLVPVGALIVAAAIAGFGFRAPWIAAALAAAALCVAAVAGPWVAAAWRRWRWATGADAIELHHGVVFHSASFVPYQRVQQIDVVSGPIERALGLASVVVRTAAATTDARIPGIAAADADATRLLLLERAGLDDAV